MRIIPPMRSTVLGVAAVAAVALAGCGSHAVKSTAGSSGTSSRSAQAKPAPAKLYGQAELTAATLSLKDMPTGYTILDQSDSSDDSTDPPCLVRANNLMMDVKASATAKDRVEYVMGGTMGLHVVQSIASATDAGRAAKVLEAARAYVRECPTYTVDGGLVPATAKVDEANYDGYGDESYSWVETLDGPVPITVAEVVIRKGNMVENLLYGTVGTVDPAAATNLFRIAAGKLPTA
jgi:hypothetical protein